MEQNLGPFDDLEYMKMAMLKHEEIFKQQVYELHRLYRIQKLLMRTSQRKISNEKKHMKNLLLDMERPSEDCFDKQPRKLDHFDEDDDEAIDLSLGLGNCYNSHKKKSKQASANRLQTYDPVMSFSSSSTGSSSHSKKACVNGRKHVGYQEQSRQQDRAIMEQPPWLLQVLSLNMT